MCQWACQFHFAIARHPTVIADAKELAKAVADEEAQKRIQGKVDFQRQQLLLFAWSGSGLDKLTPEARKEELVFKYIPGLTRDLRQHVRLFAIPKRAKWKVVQEEVNGINKPRGK